MGRSRPFVLAGVGLVALCTSAVGCTTVVVLEDDETAVGDPDPSSPSDPAPDGMARCETLDTSLVVDTGSVVEVLGSADDSTCDTWLVGSFGGTVTFADGTSLDGAAEWDGFVGRFDPQGKPRWVVRVEGDPHSWSDLVAKVIVDGRGRSWVVGSTEGALRLDGVLSFGGTGHFILALDEGGNARWISRLSYYPTHLEEKDGMVTLYGVDGGRLVTTTFDDDGGDPEEHVLATGPMGLLAVARSEAGIACLLVQNGEIAVGEQTLAMHDSLADDADLSLVTFAPTGTVRWTKQLAESGFTPFEGRLAMGDDGRVHAFVSYAGTIAAGGSTFMADADDAMSLLRLTFDVAGGVIGGDSFASGDLVLPLWSLPVGDGSVAWAGVVAGGSVEFGSSTLASDGFHRLGFLARSAPSGAIGTAQELTDIELVGGEHAAAPIVVRRVYREDQRDRGVRITRDAFETKHDQL